jgi:hypothetical protein
LISNKLESGGGVGVQGFPFSHDRDTAQWFEDHRGVISIFVDGLSMMHAMIATVTHTAEANRSKEAANKIDIGVNTSGKAGAQIPHPPLGDDSSPRGI